MENKNFNGEKIIKKGFNSARKNKVVRSIRDIDVEERSYMKNDGPVEFEYSNNNNRFWKKIILYLSVLAIVVGLLTFFFHTASFEIKNKVKNLAFKNEILKANNINSAQDEIPFKLLNINFEMEKSVESKMVEAVSKKATGKIKIINNTNKVQRLRKETRFEVNGKIFKTYKSAVIPVKSYVIKDAFADQPGVEYNLKKSLKMVIPGFKEVKDMDSYKNITGEIAGDFTGGFVGKKDIADSKDLELKKKILTSEVNDNVLIKSRTQLPQDSILNHDGVFTKINFDTVKKGDNLKLIAKVNAKVIIFNEKDFLAVITGLKKEEVENYKISSKAFLKFKILNKEKLSIDNLKKFNFELNGNLSYYKIFNKNDFVELVKGLSDKEYKKVVEKNYSKDDILIKKSVFPFWLSSVPNDKARISIEIVKDDE